MLRISTLLVALGIAAGASVGPASAAPAAPAAPAAHAASKAAYTSAETPLGDLLDAPKALAVLQKHIPDLIANSGIEMGRGMTLKQPQSYAGDQLTDAKLVASDALAKLSTK